MDRIKYYYEEERDVSYRAVQSPFIPRSATPFPHPFPSSTLSPAVSFHGSDARALKPKSRKFGPFPTMMPPSTTPQGMHFSYPHDITVFRRINRSGEEKWRKKVDKRQRKFAENREISRERTLRSDERDVPDGLDLRSSWASFSTFLTFFRQVSVQNSKLQSKFN